MFYIRRLTKCNLDTIFYKQVVFAVLVIFLIITFGFGLPIDLYKPIDHELRILDKIKLGLLRSF